MAKARVTFCGGVGSVTGANFLLEVQDKKFLIDCGLIQGSSQAHSQNEEPFPYNPHDISVLFVTHAHMDHIGRIPKLVHEGFRGRIVSTGVTKALAPLMFEDALSVMAYEQREKGIKPLYEENDVKSALTLWEELPYHKQTSYGPLQVTAKDAGHILGSAMFEIVYEESSQTKRTIVFTGDLGNSPSLLLRDTEAITDADYMVMESVYGNRNHEALGEREDLFKEIVVDTIKRGGTVVIPAFSLERTQMILYLLNNLIEDKEIPGVPVFLDSPLAIKVTDVYKHASQYFKDDIKMEIKQGDDIFDFPGLKETMRRKESADIVHIPGPKIVIAGSGMSEGGRIAYHEAHYVSDPKNTLLLVGYQGTGTLGRRLMEGVKKIKIDKEDVSVKAHVEHIFGFSSHKDRDHLIEFVEQGKSTLKKVFVVMGEQQASTFLAQRLRDYVGVEAVVPEKGETVELQ